MFESNFRPIGIVSRQSYADSKINSDSSGYHPFHLLVLYDHELLASTLSETESSLDQNQIIYDPRNHSISLLDLSVTRHYACSDISTPDPL